MSAAYLRTALAAVFFACLNAMTSHAQALKCETGPVTKTYGSGQWLVYSCSDSKSVAVISAPGNPATPFYFLLHPSDGGYKLEGEGTGDKNATNAAAQELQKLSESNIVVLIEETRKGQNVPAR